MNSSVLRKNIINLAFYLGIPLVWLGMTSFNFAPAASQETNFLPVVIEPFSSANFGVDEFVFSFAPMDADIIEDAQDDRSQAVDPLPVQATQEQNENSEKEKGGENPENTPEPSLTNTPEPTETKTPVPTETNTPVPTETNTPVPTETNTPVPSSTNTPKPKATNTPEPTETNTPEPPANNEHPTPKPKDTETPEPKETKTPKPTKESETPEPTETKTPKPKESETPGNKPPNPGKPPKN